MAQTVNIEAFNTAIEFKIIEPSGDAVQLTTVFNADGLAMDRKEFERNGRLILATHEFLADELAKLYVMNH